MIYKNIQRSKFSLRVKHKDNPNSFKRNLLSFKYYLNFISLEIRYSKTQNLNTRTDFEKKEVFEKTKIIIAILIFRKIANIFWKTI